MFTELLPGHVRVVVADSWMWNTPAAPDEEALITRAVEKRRREFRASRHAARQALTTLDITGFSLLSGMAREPLWPPGVVGAITHTGKFCAVAIAHHSKTLGLGIDAEENQPLTNELKPLICTAAESAWVAEQEQAGRTWVSKLIFSAKECVHKVYYPLNRHTLDFLDAEIEVDLFQQRFHVRIIKPLATAPVPLLRLEGCFRVDEHHVYSAIHLPQR